MNNKSKIRLSEYEIKTIKELAKEIYGNDTRVWIFGSRADPDKTGGDIDIYIETENLENLVDRQIKYLSRLKLKIGDQKVDLIVKPHNCQEEICLEAKTTGVRIL